MFKQNLFKHLLSILAVASITSFAGVGVSYAEGDEAVSVGGEIPAETDQSDKKENCEKYGGTWSDDVCKCEKANTVEKDGICVCKDGYKLEGAESLAEENAKCVVDENAGTGSIETPTGSDPVGAATGIKIATKSFNDARFSYVRRDLDNTIATIRDVVSNAITNTNNIAALQSGKQTRPDDNHACAEGKTCLLVTDTSGIRNWYEIIDCNENAFFSNMGNGIGPGSRGGKYCDNGYVTAASGYRDCTSSEWGHLYENGMVYGVARAVAIAEAPGAVVTLPNNVAVGDTCVCRVTGYAPLVSGTFAGRNAVYASTPTSFTTDKWVVGGKISTYYTSAPGTAMTDANCVDVCGFGTGDNGALKAMYFASVSNTCMASASDAQMCRYYPFLDMVATDGQYAGTGSKRVGGSGWNMCASPASGSVWATHCVDDGWVTKYTLSGGTEEGYVWGRAGFMTLPSGTTTGDVINGLASHNFSTTYNETHNAVVCVVDGFKNGNNAEQSVNFDSAVVYSTSYSGSGSWSSPTACAEWSQTSSAMRNFYSVLADICVAY